jgi:hypothetical protein
MRRHSTDLSTYAWYHHGEVAPMPRYGRVPRDPHNLQQLGGTRPVVVVAVKACYTRNREILMESNVRSLSFGGLLFPEVSSSLSYVRAHTVKPTLSIDFQSDPVFSKPPGVASHNGAPLCFPLFISSKSCSIAHNHSCNHVSASNIYDPPSLRYHSTLPLHLPCSINFT